MRTPKPPLFLLSLLLSAAAPLLGQKTLFVYDGPANRSEAFKTAAYLHKTLNHFSISSRSLEQVFDYRPGQVDEVDFIFVVFEEGTPAFPPILIQDLLQTKATIIWVNLHIEKLLDRSAGQWGLVHMGLDFASRWRVAYKGKEFEKEDPELNMISISAPQVRVLATAFDTTGRRLPYILNSRNLWYVADAPYSYAREGGRFLILADVLHEILGQDHPPSRRALVRIEDITPLDNPPELRRLANFLFREKVPFQISLVPKFRDPEFQTEVDLSDQPELSAAVRHMVGRGGTVILHGITHQHRGLSADDYEFWDDVSGEPLRYDSPEWIRQRLRQGLQECFRNGIYPLAWETPHYSASQNTYRVLSEFFDTFNDRLMAADLSGAQILSPFPFRVPELDVTVIPENLGYIDLENPDPGRLLKQASNLQVVRDGMASFFFHPFVPLKHLKRLVRELKAMGWEFVSIRDFGCNLRTESQWVTSSGGRGSVTAANQYIHELALDRNGRVRHEEFGTIRQGGIVQREVVLPQGNLFVLEALDLLPERQKYAGPAWIMDQKSMGSSSKIPLPERALRITTAGLITVRARSAAEENDQKSFQAVLRYFGFIPTLIPAADLSAASLRRLNLLVVPNPAARSLGGAAINTLLQFVEEGGSLITDGRSPLAESLGFRFEERLIQVEEVKEQTLPGQNLRWNPPVRLNPFAARDSTVLSSDARSGAPLACLASLGRGRVLFLGALFDDLGPLGINRYAYFPHYLKNSLGLPFHVRRNQLEYYCDPGLRPNASWEKLVKQWRAGGVKTVYLATWHFYRNWSFNYRYFIRLCHAQGLAVYAWFEFPQVTPLLWEEHPEWREKTATGRDGLCHWRLQMNLQNPKMREEARLFLRRILLDYDWDGVNLAELNFDTNKGAADPAKFVPLNSDVRRAFRQESGFDPLELFKPDSPRYHRSDARGWEAFLRYRTRLTAEWHAFFLEEIERVRKAKNRELEVIVTALDSLNHPEIIEECGLDTSDILRLMDRFPFVLQIEDPSLSWILPPDRYVSLAKAYLKHIPDPERLMFDVNIISRRDIKATTLPSPQATGTELAATIFYAGLPSGRVGIYSESSVHPLDMDLLPFVMGSDVEIEPEPAGFLFKARKPFQLFWSGEGIVPYLDGRPWPFATNESLSVPSGTHRLTFGRKKRVSFESLEHRILLEADVRDLRVDGSTIRLSYESPFVATLSANRPLEKVRVDSREVSLAEGELNVLLPRGRHELEVLLQNPAFQVLDEVGYASSSAFFLVGLTAVLLLAALYIQVRWRR